MYSPRTVGASIVLESELLRVTVDPGCGGRIRSLISKRTGVEYLYQDTRTRFLGPSYSDHDISGYMECFPTVAPCKYPDGKRAGMELGDHGMLWQDGWESRIDGGSLVLSKDLPGLGCRFERRCYLQSAESLSLDYSVTNYGNDPLKFVYSAHPLLAARRDTRLELPGKVSEAFVGVALNVPGVRDRTWIDWPPAVETGLMGPLDAGRRSVTKLFTSRLATPWAQVRHGDSDEALRFEWSADRLPYLGFLYQQGFSNDPDGHFRNELILALEPTSGIGDDLPTCEFTGTVSVIDAGQEMTFRITLSLE